MNKVIIEFEFKLRCKRSGEVTKTVEVSGSLNATNIRDTFEAAARGLKEGLLHDEQPKEKEEDGFEPVR